MHLYVLQTRHSANNEVWLPQSREDLPLLRDLPAALTRCHFSKFHSFYRVVGIAMFAGDQAQKSVVVSLKPFALRELVQLR